MHAILTADSKMRRRPEPVAPPSRPSGVWGDEWLAMPLGWQDTRSSPADLRSPDELVFLMPGHLSKRQYSQYSQYSKHSKSDNVVSLDVSTVCCDDTQDGQLFAIDDGIRFSLATGINAAYRAPQLLYAHELLALVSWYGIVATGRDALLPVALATRVPELRTGNVAAVLRAHYRNSVQRWRLRRRIEKASRKVLQSTAPVVVRGVALRQKNSDSQR